MNFIHPTAIIGEKVILGDNNFIGPFCYMIGEVVIGGGNRFEAYCSIGTAPEHKAFWKGAYKGVRIGNGCTIREYVTINGGTEEETRIGSHVICLRGTHIGHDATIGDNVTLSCNVLIGGHTIVARYANIGLGAIIHQRQLIAEGCMIGMGAIVTKKLLTEPYKTYVGNPARLLGDNIKNPHYGEYTINMKDNPL